MTYNSAYTGPQIDKAARLASIIFVDLPAMLADARDYTAHTAGDVFWAAAEGFRYRVAASDATDHHLTTAGGVKVYVLPGDNGWYNFKAFNPAADGTTDDYDALITAIEAVSIAGAASWQLGGPTLVIPEDTYKINTTVNLKRYIRIIGNASGGPNAMGPILLFAADTTGFIFNRANTFGTGLETPSTTGPEHALIEGIRIHSAGGTDTSKHGVWMRAAEFLRSCEIKGFPGNGIHIVATARAGNWAKTYANLAAMEADTTGYGPGVNFAVDEIVYVTADTQFYRVIDSTVTVFDVKNVAGVLFEAVEAASIGGAEGNANLWYLDKVGSTNNGLNGLYVQGADTNAGVCIMGHFVGNGRWGIFDRSFLGNTYIGCHCASNGQATNGDNTSAQSSVVWYGGNRYAAVPAPLLGTTEDTRLQQLVHTVPGTNPLVWEDRGPSQQFPGSPEWQPDQPLGTYFPGGHYYMRGAVARNILLGCYGESDGAGSAFMGPTMVLGGLISQIIAGSGGMLTAGNGGDFQATSYKYANVVNKMEVESLTIGEPNVNALFRWSSSEHGSSTNQFRFKRIGKDWYVDYANLSANRVLRITGPQTTEQMGTGAAVVTTMAFPHFGLGVGTNTRRMTHGYTAAPTTGAWARGDIVWNRDPAAAGYAGWICVTAGTPGTWKRFGAIEA